jgi:hypothetical protein
MAGFDCVRGTGQPETELVTATGDPGREGDDGDAPAVGEHCILAGVIVEDDVKDEPVVACIEVMAVAAEGAAFT